ncbi:hypothetical protein CB0940_08180 [Cercospora beticola]|uniref:Uncharacterized protein n=1 Tax=Cercospora beticola TaxID=122368 RepID=A0A2G5HP16_CERBT|nr:hypothetical protein CB0940_08180 [Cercospora beticola]PIA94296.1 hypothetical protein CB0940_08180 [Cercospora beticola]WPB04746.1 hypothetical protein RHO25_009393 [Cercospora beticola]
MSFPNRITKDTSARKGPAPLAPHDAALQAYMQTFVNSIHDNTALATHARHSEHLHDSQALKVCFIESYNDAVRKLNKKFADDLTTLNAERDKKVAELRREFASDPLATIVKQQNVAAGRNEQSATGRNEQSHPRVEQAAKVAAGEPLAASIKQEPVEDPTQAAPTPTVLEGVSTVTPATETANASSTIQSAGVSSGAESVSANAITTSEAQQQSGGCAEVGIAGSSGTEGGQDCEDLVKVKSEVIQTGLESRDVRADSVIAASDDQLQHTAPLDDCPGTDDSTDRPASNVYVDLTTA